jgi:hypothetical protein
MQLYLPPPPVCCHDVVPIHYKSCHSHTFYFAAQESAVKRIMQYVYTCVSKCIFPISFISHWLLCSKSNVGSSVNLQVVLQYLRHINACCDKSSIRLTCHSASRVVHIQCSYYVTWWATGESKLDFLIFRASTLTVEPNRGAIPRGIAADHSSPSSASPAYSSWRAQGGLQFIFTPALVRTVIQWLLYFILLIRIFFLFLYRAFW